MLVNLYFYNMDNQLSLFGFEEPVAPIQPANTSKIEEKMEEAHEQNELENAAPENEASTEELAIDHESASVAFEEETTKSEAFLEGELNEVVQPNKTLVTVESLLHQAAVEYPIYDPLKKEDPEPSTEITSEDDNIAKEGSDDGSVIETTPIATLDEVVIPNQEVPVIENILEEELQGIVIQNDSQEETDEVESLPVLDEETPMFQEEKLPIEAPLGEITEIEPSSEIEEETVSSKIHAQQPNNVASPEKEEEIPSIAKATPIAESFGKKGRKSFKEIDAEVDLIQVPSDEVLFSKQYYPISQVAKWFRVNNSLLRFWENEFDILKPRKNRKGDRLFRPEDVKNLQIIYYLLRQKKYTISGARKFIKNNRKTVDVNMKVVQTLNDFKRFLLELKVNSER